MAKTKKRAPDKEKQSAEPQVEETSGADEQAEETRTATAVEAPPAEKPERKERTGGGDQQSSGGGSQGSEDVSAIDAETNAKYEQVKGGKLYIKDLQQM